MIELTPEEAAAKRPNWALELFYDDVMEGPIEAKMLAIHPDGRIDFEVTDVEHKKLYSFGGQMMVRARLLMPGSIPARHDEYVCRAKETPMPATDERT